ncbi:hypothetical protein PoB_000186300 [Plakobranchus ocellatus]|uniref:Reverse transcriptase domain-containing protein n=1 Tax=Plakobranchus ocellatus TaxID=259542 RepID=A0AAV3XYR3_9GAST|nr:hypothetical protein PoB_000186300 [Plakobranchus ocellatus]
MLDSLQGNRKEARGSRDVVYQKNDEDIIGEKVQSLGVGGLGHYPVRHRRGIPQGSVLRYCCTLFLFFMKNIGDAVRAPIRYSYTNDIVH